MNILISNDDGYQAPGLVSLVAGLSRNNDHKLSIIAPDRNRSGASNSLTLERPLLPHPFQFSAQTQINPNNLQQCYYMNGTPTDCVHIGLTGLLRDTPPDIVISGINSGANMGDDVLYSGTIAAATEGRFLGMPALALSLDCLHDNTEDSICHFDSAARFVQCLLRLLPDCPLPEDSILNINIPNLPWSQIKGIQTTRLGKRHCSEPAIAARDPRNRRIFWLGPVGKAADAGPGTDFYAVSQGFISITPLKIDLTDERLMMPLQEWLNSDSFVQVFDFAKVDGHA